MPDASSAERRASHGATGASASKRVTWLCAVAWALTLGLGAYLRVNGVAAAIVGDEIAANGPDSAYHARRMLQTWQHYPHVSDFEPLFDWPHGAVAPWPPGFDFIVATLALPARDRSGALVMISLAPVLLGMALVVLAGWAARRLAPASPWWVGWLAATLVAIFPQAVSVARFGNPDHHIAEALIMLGLGLWSHAGWQALASGAPSRARRIGFELAGAALVTIAIASFIGTPMYAWIAAASLALANLLWGRGARLCWAAGAPALALGAAGGALVYRGSIAEHGQLFSYVYPSLLQPLLVSAAALGCAVASLLGWAWSRGPRARGACLAFVPALIAVALLVPSGRAALAEVLHGLYEWFADSSSPLAALTENQPLFTAYAPGLPFWSRAHRYYGVFGIALPLLIGAGLLLHVRRDGLRRTTPFVIWTGCVVVLMLLQNRFGRVGLVNLAICTAFVFDAAVRARRWARHLVWAAPLLAFAFDPAFAFYRWPERGDMPLPGIQEASVFLRAHTPPPRAGSRSGVLVRWDAAHFIVRYAERPVTATGYGVYVAPDAIDEVARIWLDAEPHLMRFAQQRDLGFVALSASDFQSVRLHGQGPMLGAQRWNAEYFQRVPLAALLLAGSGSADAGFAHIEHLMPRFASTMQAAGFPAFLPDAWLYEIVAGAVVRGHAQPNATVRLRTALRVRDQPFVHEAWTRAGSDGAFELRTPLPTGYRGEHFETGAQARLSIGDGARRSVAVPESAVRAGAVVSVSAD
jgi:hypothetical protein